MSSKVGKRPLRSLSAHEKMDAIRRVHDGESKASVARDIGVPESTLRGWCKNEDKILYLSRQSTPDTDDSEPKEKKIKFEPLTLPPQIPDTQPFNLSVRPEVRPEESSYSPPPTQISQDIIETPTSRVSSTTEPMALNLSKPEQPKTERERNRAELNRLSIEFGLNRPEMFLPNANMAANLSDLSASLSANLGFVTQWNNTLLQGSNNKKKPEVAAPITTPTTTQPKPKPRKDPKLDTGVDDSVWYWLKTQQAMLGLVQNTQNNVDPNSSWFWKWYKQIATYDQQQLPIPQPEKPILYQQLTKDTNSENFKLEDPPKPTKSTTKARAVLDNLLLNNNNNNDAMNDLISEDQTPKKEFEVPTSPSEALIHGEKFLKWLERCGDPSVTAVQLLQFRYLLNNVKTCAERKNGVFEHKTKVRSRK